MSGSIEIRAKDSFRLVVSGGVDLHGKRIKHSRTFHGDNRGAKQALAAFVFEVAQGTVGVGCKMLLRDWAKMWLAQHEKRVAPRTIETYREHLENRILPSLGHIPLEKLQPKHINCFLAQLEQDGNRLDGRDGVISNATSLRHLRTLSVMLQEAVYRQLITLNPARAVRAPRVQFKEARWYNEHDVKLLIAKLQGEPAVFRAMILIASLVGLRRGEIIGLEWSSIDWDNRTIAIRQSVQILTKTGQSLKEPKSASSKRTVALPGIVLQALLTWRDEQTQLQASLGSKWRVPKDFICTTACGTWLSANQLTRAFKEFIERNGLPTITLHGLRHTAASLLISNGLNIRTVSSILGHSQASTTLNIYSHTFHSSLREAANIVDTMLNP